MNTKSSPHPDLRPRRASEARRTSLSACALAILVGLCGCSTQPAPDSPKGALQALIDAWGRGALDELERRVVPEQAHSVVDTLSAVRDFLAANDALCRHVRDQVGLGIVDQIDQSYVAMNLNVFSPNIRLLDETITGERARVRFVINDTLPPRDADLRRIDGRWMYDAGEGFHEGVPEAFCEMAAGLQRVLNDLRSGDPPAAEIRRDSRILMERVRDALSPGAAKLGRG